MGKSNGNGIKQLMKKKSVDRIIFSTMSLMNTVTTGIDISSPLSGAIIEEDLDKIRKDLNNSTRESRLQSNLQHNLGV